jgi:hypothetical protein
MIGQYSAKLVFSGAKPSFSGRPANIHRYGGTLTTSGLAFILPLPNFLVDFGSAFPSLNHRHRQE